MCPQHRQREPSRLKTSRFKSSDGSKSARGRGSAITAGGGYSSTDAGGPFDLAFDKEPELVSRKRSKVGNIARQKRRSSW